MNHQHIDRRRFQASLTRGALGLAATALLGGCGEKLPESIKIGVAQPLSGPLAALGQDMLNGVKLALADLNQAGFAVDGKRIALELVAVDDKSEEEIGKLVARQLVDAGVCAVIGHLDSGVSIAAAPIYAAANVAQIAISTNPRFTQLGFATTFRMVGNDTLQAQAMASFAMAQLRAAHFAVLDDGTPYGLELANGVGAQLKAKKKDLVLRKSFDTKTLAFDELAQAIKDGPTQVIVSTLSDYQALALLEALHKAGHDKLSLLGSDAIKTSDMTRASGLVQGVYATSPVLEAREFSASRAFLDKYRAAYKAAPAYAGHYSYGVTHVLAAAIEQARSVQPKNITEALHQINGYAPVIGTMDWDTNGELRYTTVGVYELRGGNWELRMRSDRW